jgi:hypothetical protein
MLQAAIWRRSGCAQALHAPVGPNKGNLRFQHSKLLAGLWKSCLHSSQPVKAGLCERPEDWEWSSFRHYATGCEGRVEIESE